MKFLLASLPHNAHAQNIALALHESGSLGAYRSGAVDNYRHRWSRTTRQLVGAALPQLARLLQRRQIRTIPQELVYPQRTFDALVALARTLHVNEGVRDRLWELSERLFDEACARLMEGPSFDAYFGVEHGALRAAQTAKNLGKPVVIGFFSPHHETLRKCVFTEYSKHPELVSPYVDQLVRLAPRRNARKDQEAGLADVIHTASTFTARSLTENAHVDPSKIMTIPLGGPDPVLRSSLPSGVPQRIRFMYSGQVSVVKGVHYLFKAWEMMGRTTNASLDVFGAQRLPAEALAKLPRDITLHGHVGATELFDAYRHASVFVFPTLYDGFGLVVQEALSRGVPVITTANAGAADLIQHGKNGFIVPAHDAVALAERMQWCVEHPREISMMRIAALETARFWTWDRFRKSLRANLSQVLGKDLEPSASVPKGSFNPTA
jgi:glycosyltransferase involved in cell wall biosynthesis